MHHDDPQHTGRPRSHQFHRALCLRRCPSCGVWCELPRTHYWEHCGRDYVDEQLGEHWFSRDGHDRKTVTSTALA